MPQTRRIGLEEAATRVVCFLLVLLRGMITGGWVELRRGNWYYVFLCKNGEPAYARITVELS